MEPMQSETEQVLATRQDAFLPKTGWGAGNYCPSGASEAMRGDGKGWETTELACILSCRVAEGTPFASLEPAGSRHVC